MVCQLFPLWLATITSGGICRMEEMCKKDARLAALIKGLWVRSINSYEAAYRLSLSSSGLRVRPSFLKAAYHETAGDFSPYQETCRFLHMGSSELIKAWQDRQIPLNRKNDYQVNTADDVLSPELFEPPYGYQDARSIHRSYPSKPRPLHSSYIIHTTTAEGQTRWIWLSPFSGFLIV